MIADNKIVHGLWIGSELSALELLTIKSFLYYGHEFHLWVYESIQTPLPDGVVIRNANDILAEKHVFRYKNKNSFGHGKGSLAGFSDIFRYKLLYEQGGWWADMDVTCLKPLSFLEPYVFRTHDILAVVGNLMKSPKGAPLMKASFEQAFETVTAENTDWLKPVVILNEHIARLGLSKYIKHRISNPDISEIVDLYRYYSVGVPKKYHVIHWMNEQYRTQDVDKNSTIRGSFLDSQMIKHDIFTDQLSLSDTSAGNYYYSP